MRPDEGKLTLSSPYFCSDCVLVGNGSLLSIAHTGSSVLHTPSGPLRLNDVLYVLDLSHSFTLLL